MRGRSQSVDDEVSFQHGDSDVNNVNTTQGITDDE